MVRLKHRYLLVDFLYPSAATTAPDLPPAVQFHQPSSDKLTPGYLVKVIRDAIAEQFGDYGAGMTSGTLTIKYLSPATSTAIIRVARDHYRLVWAALTMLSRLPAPISQDCVIHVVRVSGTIRKAEEEAIRRAKTSMRRARGDSSAGLADALTGAGPARTEAEQNAFMGGMLDDEPESE
ncbi:uncharacterized protein K452DRAFT_317254 [Aplosporella prunicola CBS 121167]|uniref:Ribonuclease P/MRP protein subunit POP5 n=1 Tax=Aplosporella prunicola CBS 121167 TaxID=1176127 RepID=A0A6A6BJL5_9PEZI|nr:uncharacterized protein K452DRAFT_317254 [Aplosporella prunicola CBS 121167]KAF2143818.1 hypothetical protein K452DRAFT_317254 [Aplosporella prunicola CBS 121167]